jgi:predicted transport protein
MPLFQLTDATFLKQLIPNRFTYERQLQQLVESNLLQVFGVHFVASEFTIGGEQPGRIDTLGLSSEGEPTIIEYKRAENENVINQGLYYMNWLIDHRGDFIVAAQKGLGSLLQNVEINWNHPRLIVIAQSYAKWDTYAVKRMGDGIELWKYVLYDEAFLHFEQVYGQQRVVQPQLSSDGRYDEQPDDIHVYSTDFHFADKPEHIKTLFETLREGILAFAQEEGEIIETPNKLYISYRHGKNFCEIEPQARGLKIHLDIPYSEINDPKGYGRDVSNVGHWGTGDVEIKVSNANDLEYALDLIEQSYRRTL